MARHKTDKRVHVHELAAQQLKARCPRATEFAHVGTAAHDQHELPGELESGLGELVAQRGLQFSTGPSADDPTDQ